MTAVTDAATVLDTLVGRVTSTDERLRVAAAFVSAKENGTRIASLQPTTADFVDPENPTNEEKAQLFLDCMKWFGQEVVSKNAGRTTREGNDAAVAAAEAAARADME